MMCFYVPVFLGEYVVADPYWSVVAEDYDADVEALSFYNGEWYYQEYPICVGMGGSGGSCNTSNLYCAGTCRVV